MAKNMSALKPPSRIVRAWAVRVTPPRAAVIKTDEDAMRFAASCRWPAGWVATSAREVDQVVYVTLTPEAAGDPALAAPGVELTHLDQTRLAAFPGRAHVGGGWYLVEGGGRTGMGARGIGVPIQDYETVGGSLLRVVQERVPGVASRKGEDDWGMWVEVAVMEAGRDDQDILGHGMERAGACRMMHVAGVATLVGGDGAEEVSPGHWIRRYVDGGLPAWLGAASSS